MLTISLEEANALVKPELDAFKVRARQYYLKESEDFSNWDQKRQIKFINYIVEKAHDSGIVYENDVIVFGDLNLQKLREDQEWFVREDVRNILGNEKLKSGVKILQLYSLE